MVNDYCKYSTSNLSKSNRMAGDTYAIRTQLKEKVDKKEVLI